VAATDTYGLYNPRMATDLNIAGIARAGTSGSYDYSVIGSQNHPVTYVSWGDAARFSNWLNNGQPTGAQNAGTTENGAYTLNGATDTLGLSAVSRNSAAKWFIPSENEWYKAAYYQPAAHGGDVDSYWYYPMRTNNTPYSDQPAGATLDNTRVGNFYLDDGLANSYNDGYAVTGSKNRDDSHNYLTDARAYFSSPSYYGTFDQGGNVWEWNETQISGLFRGVRGGSWFESVDFLPDSFRFLAGPVYESNDFGFRVATVPEPGALLITLNTTVILLSRRRPTSHNRA
jgi:formylglycine-generating enzyme required for sulfatase activity